MDKNEVSDKIMQCLLLFLYVELCGVFFVVSQIWLKVIAGVLLLVFGAWVFCYIWRLKSNYDKEQKNHSHNIRNCNSHKIEYDEILAENKSLKAGNESLKEENESLKEENESLKAGNESLKEENESLKAIMINAPKPPIPPKTNRVEYYDSPNSDGQFRQSQCKTIESMDCFYSIKYESGSQSGVLELLDRQNYIRLLDFKSNSLYPVCQVESERQNARTVVETAPGKVVLIDGVWNIENGKKIKIRIE